MKNKGYTVESVMTTVRATSDGGLSVGFHTKELSAKEKAEIMEFHNQAGWLLFAENQIQEDSIPQQDTEITTKSPSMRLRGTLFILWDQNGREGEFEQYYRTQMEKFINHVKSKLI